MENDQSVIAGYYAEKGLDPEVFEWLDYGFLWTLGYGADLSQNEEE